MRKDFTVMADKLQRCALAFQKLIDIQYEFVIGRKGQTTKIILDFSETEFVHLAGLHKLVDNDFFRTASRKKVFDNILDGNISYDDISKSENSDLHFCRSFFPKEDKDYTVGQAKYTLLCKCQVKMYKIGGVMNLL